MLGGAGVTTIVVHGGVWTEMIPKLLGIQAMM